VSTVHNLRLLSRRHKQSYLPVLFKTTIHISEKTFRPQRKIFQSEPCQHRTGATMAEPVLTACSIAERLTVIDGGDYATSSPGTYDHSLDQTGSDITPSARVFGITELGEIILAHFPCMDMLRARRVCRRWRDIIDKHAPCQENMFLKPLPCPPYDNWITMYDSPPVPGSHPECKVFGGAAAEALLREIEKGDRTFPPWPGPYTPPWFWPYHSSRVCIINPFFYPTTTVEDQATLDDLKNRFISFGRDVDLVSRTLQQLPTLSQQDMVRKMVISQPSAYGARFFCRRPRLDGAPNEDKWECWRVRLWGQFTEEGGGNHRRRTSGQLS
jgi:hypothetical protein